MEWVGGRGWRKVKVWRISVKVGEGWREVRPSTVSLAWMHIRCLRVLQLSRRKRIGPDAFGEQSELCSLRVAGALDLPRLLKPEWDPLRCIFCATAGCA